MGVQKTKGEQQVDRGTNRCVFVLQLCLVSHLLELGDGIVGRIACMRGGLLDNLSVLACRGGSCTRMVLHRRSVQGSLLHLFGQTVQWTIIALVADGLDRDLWLRLLLLGNVLLLRNGSGNDSGPLLLLLLLWLLDNDGLLLNDRYPLGGIVVTENMLLQ